MALSENQLKSLSLLLHNPSLKVFISSAWGSDQENHRSLLHAELANVNPDKKFCSSVSHCPGVGVFILSSQPLGVDVEQTARVSEKVIARMAQAEELKAAPTSAALWCAKEAAFKALKTYDQPSVISQISIGHWANIDSQSETFKMLNPQQFSAPTENYGVIIKNASHTFSFFTFNA